MSIKTQRYQANLYEQALLLADAHSRQCNVGDQWSNFVDNLARICDEFANSTSCKQRDLFSLISTPIRPYKSN